MISNNKVSTIIERFKWHSDKLSIQEREMLRDELLTMLLFKDFNEGRHITGQTSNDSFNGLSDTEKELIKRLAEHTEKIYKLSRKGPNQNP